LLLFFEENGHVARKYAFLWSGRKCEKPSSIQGTDFAIFVKMAEHVVSESIGVSEQIMAVGVNISCVARNEQRAIEKVSIFSNHGNNCALNIQGDKLFKHHLLFQRISS